MPRKDLEAISGLQVPGANTVVFTSAVEIQTIGSKDHAPDALFMALEGLQAVSGLDIPLFEGGIGTATRQGMTIGAKGHVRYDAGVASEDFDAVSGFCIPQTNGAILTATGKERLSGMESNGPSPKIMTDTLGDGMHLCNRPNGDLSVGITRGKATSVGAKRNTGDTAKGVGKAALAKGGLGKVGAPQGKVVEDGLAQKEASKVIAREVGLEVAKQIEQVAAAVAHLMGGEGLEVAEDGLEVLGEGDFRAKVADEPSGEGF
jgi:hypothetical protein